jgi:hypothetical protein
MSDRPFNGYFKAIVGTLATLVIVAAFQLYAFVTAGPRYTAADAEADNRGHNRRLCRIERAVFQETQGDCE